MVGFWLSKFAFSITLLLKQITMTSLSSSSILANQQPQINIQVLNKADMFLTVILRRYKRDITAIRSKANIFKPLNF